MKDIAVLLHSLLTRHNDGLRPDASRAPAPPPAPQPNHDESSNDLAFGGRQRVLLITCEFWAAVQMRALLEYLGGDPVTMLVLAFEAYSEIGAVQIAAALRGSLIDCADRPSQTWLAARIAHLQDQLLATNDDLDELIVRYAARLASLDSTRSRGEHAVVDSARL